MTVAVDEISMTVGKTRSERVVYGGGGRWLERRWG